MFSSRHCSKNVVANTYYVPVAKGQDFATNNHVFPPLRLSEENENKLSTSEIVKSFPSPQHEAYSSPSPKKTSDVNNSIFQIYRDKKFDLPAHLYQSNSVEHIQKRRVDGQQRLPLFLPSFPPYSVMSSPVTMHPTISPHPIFALRRPHDTTIASKELNNAPILLLSSPLPPSPPGSFALPKKNVRNSNK
uniref:Uncharacterized protein n=1 Tax=Aureoumbra lagunensis TaxID=44058 RepID=A0A7S3JS07_9STRA|mmetsp:Transcript_2458/g.3938  ORF Transcript_2458/g.3938 Transcript_2458/m.3938 type:complete len:190 (-) Transcript_2458:90-659(-)